MVGYCRLPPPHSPHPSLGHDDPEHSLFFTAAITEEDREGGTLPGRVLPTGAAFAESQHTQRWDGGIASHWLFDTGVTLDSRFSVTSTTGLGGTPITPVWAPLDGRTFNIGIRADL